MSVALAGLKVIDFSMILPGPFCTQLLADYGADVIKIEDLNGDRGRRVPPIMQEQSARFYAINRNKKSLAVDLKKAAGVEIIRRLVAQTDVLVHAYRPGTMEKLGLGYDDLKTINGRLIYCALSGYGATGPLRQSAAHDINIVGLSGVTDLTGTARGGPAMSTVQMAGSVGGSLFAVIAILIALHHREATGLGQFCDVSMMDGLISLLAYTLADWSGWGTLPQRGAGLLTGGFACYQIYETSDHKYMSLGALEEKFWQDFCERVERPEYIALQFDRAAQDEIINNLNALFKSKTQAEWLEYFNGVDICLTPVLNLEEVINHAQVINREMLIRLSNFQNSGKNMFLAGLPIKFSATPGELKPVFPKLGEHTDEILSGLGYTKQDIAAFKADKVT